MTAPSPRPSREGRIQWLTNIPPHWRVVPSKWLFNESKQRAKADDPQLSATQAYGVIRQAEFERLVGRQVTHSFLHQDKRKHVELDDFVVSMRSFQGGLERAWATGGIRSSYVVLRPSGRVHPPFFAHLFKSTAYIQALQATSNFIRDGQDLNFNNFVLVNLPEVPYAEQQAIADILDRKTAAIDALIEKKQKLLDLLAEKRAALINQAVTKGLDPNVPMKDSGIRWIGEIPAHWGVSALRWVRRPGTSITYGIVQAGPHVEDGVPYIRVSEMSGDELPRRGYKRTSREIDHSYRRSRVAVGDLVVAIRAGVGKTLRVPDFLDGANLTQGTAKVSVREEVSADYVFWAMKSEASQSALDFASKGATFKEITLETLRKLAIPMPPPTDQRLISAFLEDRIAKGAGATRAAQTQIERLQEYRQALITTAVTGQLDLGATGSV